MMGAFCKILGRVLGKPAWTVVPGSALRLAFGQMADEVLLASQRVVPKRLLEAGFDFRHTDVKDALTTIIQGETDDESC
jgi:NAD dependent epimerase/dehydratase family enzyme